jgi:chemotaxis signal transduction protein
VWGRAVSGDPTHRRLAELRSAFDESFALPRAEPAVEPEPWLVLKVGESTFAARLGQVRAIEKLPRCVPLPGSAPEVMGLAALRGRLVPLYRLALLLGEPADDPRWVVLCGQDAPIGLALSNVEGQVRAATAQVLGAERRARPHVHELVRVGGAVWGVVDLASVAADIGRRAEAGGSGKEVS